MADDSQSGAVGGLYERRIGEPTTADEVNGYWLFGFGVLLGLDDVGRVEEGYVADLVVLDADPTEDVEAWQDPEAVFARGDRVA